MPELPEVETVRRGLAELLPGRTILSFKSDWAKSFPNSIADANTFLVGARIIEVRRRAKVLLIDLDTKYSLVIHLKMTGQLVYVKSSASSQAEERFGAGHPSPSLAGVLPDKSTRVTLELDEAFLFFNDQRKFGWMRLMPTVEIEQLDFFKKVGPEPLAANFTAKVFIERLLRRKKSTSKAVLLDQTVIAGVGNIYADESLWAAKIHPSTLLCDIDSVRLNILFKELQRILRLAIEKGGSTDKNYVNAEGRMGSYLSFAQVFRREGLPCLRCGTTIVKLRVASRGTHICPTCQKVL